ncbi:hypothetical protein B5S31_g3347 [[Candida] boidinii]|nr:hypothetical protein B5S31_g3347 [[Candida] boidinii]
MKDSQKFKKLCSEFDKHLNIFKNSKIYKELIDYFNAIDLFSTLNEKKVTTTSDINPPTTHHSLLQIKCLGIGSISSNKLNSIYQLILIKTIFQDNFKINNENIYLYDPAFTDLDIYFIKNHLNYSILKDKSSNILSNIIYYMPHIPIDVFEKIIIENKPILMLTNDISLYNLKFTKSEFYNKFPNLSKLGNLLDTLEIKINTNTSTNTSTSDTSDNTSKDDFQIVTKKKSKKRQNKYILKENNEINYSEIKESIYYNNLKTFKRFENGNNINEIWQDSFSHMCYYELNLADPILKTNSPKSSSPTLHM